MDAILPRPKAFIYMKQRAVSFLYPPMWDFERHSNNSPHCLSFHKYWPSSSNLWTYQPVEFLSSCLRIFSCGYLLNCNCVIINTFSDKMKSNVDVFSPLMIYWILSQMNFTLAITVYDWYLLTQSKTIQKTMHPNTLFYSLSQWPPFIQISCIIRIYITYNSTVLLTFKYQTDISGTSQISHDPFHCFPVYLSRITHEPAYYTYSMWNIWSSAHHGIHETTNCTWIRQTKRPIINAKGSSKDRIQADSPNCWPTFPSMIEARTLSGQALL